MRHILAVTAALVLPGALIAQAKPAPTARDYGKWETPGPATLSPNGQWLAYAINRVNEENELRLRPISRDTTLVFSHASGAAFTPDSRWLAFTIGLPPATRERLERERKPIRNGAGILNLGTNQVDSVADVASFRFSADGRYIALRRYPAEGKRTADLIVQDLATGLRTTLGNVNEFSWSERRPLLAMTVETEGGAGNALLLYDARNSSLRVLDSSPSLYRSHAWRPKSADLAVLRTQVEKQFRDTTHTVLAWTALDGNTTAYKLDATAPQIAADVRIAESRRPEWSKDGSAIIIGLRQRVRAKADSAMKAAEPAEKVSDVQVWHTRDVRLMRQQEMQSAQDEQRAVLAIWQPAQGNLTRVTSDLMESTSVLPNARFATETDRKPYAWGQMFGRNYQDLWLINSATGERSKVLEKVRYTNGASPSGRKLLWYDGKDYWSLDVATGTRTNLTAKANADFGNPDWDFPGDMRPPSGFVGWAKGEKNVLIYDKYDLWSVAADGSGATRLTNGREQGIVYRYLRLGSDEDGVDLRKPLMLSTLHHPTKKFGFARLTAGSAPVALLSADERITRLMRADSADVFAFTRENFGDAPDWFVGSRDLGKAQQVSNINAFEKDYSLGKSELVNFTSATGRPLQAALFYPANYDPARRYPMIVYTYELLSQGVHNYVAPSERSGCCYNTAAWTANGYFVLYPDIVFRPRDPGVSTLEAVVPAVRTIVARGLVDSARVGHIGHSWGGYQAVFLPTRTTIFAASVAGAGITNFLSFNGAVHWAGGNAEYDHWETGQARMDVPPWEDLDAYLRNSPIAKIQDLGTPVLLMTGDADGTVDWKQSLEFYNAARRAGRHDVVMLVYPGEDHALRKKENQIDYHRRIIEWFGHYLKGEPAPKWIREGTTWLERKAVLDTK